MTRQRSANSGEGCHEAMTLRFEGRIVKAVQLARRRGLLAKSLRAIVSGLHIRHRESWLRLVDTQKRH